MGAAGMLVKRETRRCANAACTSGPDGGRAVLRRRPKEFARVDSRSGRAVAAPTCCPACTNALPVHGRRTLPADPTGVLDATAPLAGLVYRDGYPCVRVGAEHPAANRQGYARLSHLVVARVEGRWLLPNERVIYRDGNRENVAPENLVLVVRRNRRGQE